MKLFFATAFYLFIFDAFTQAPKLVYAADFSKPISNSEWIIELQPEANSKVYTENGKLILDTKGGVTVWLNKLLEVNFQIEYRRAVIMSNGVNDRLSDLNQFWMASDPRNRNLFTNRSGVFAEYDSLELYYVGMGGNENTTTRFRKYNGHGDKKILQEYSDEDHLLKTGHQYLIKIIVKDGVTSFWIDGKSYFSYDDPNPLTQGYFGFRSLHSRQEIMDFRIYELP
jgi:rhamnogalacturonan endolyase